MLTIIHGSDIAASRNFFISEKNRITGSILLREEIIDLTYLTQLLEAGGLFEDSKTIFIEEFLSRRKKSTQKDAIISYLARQSKTHQIYLWEGKELTVSTLNPFKGAVVKNFKLPSTLFAFLDALKPENGRQLIRLFHETGKSTEPEMIFFMLVRQVRLMLALSGNQEESISELKRLSPWQKAKTQKQAQLFGLVKLEEIYSRLFEIELAQKTGNLNQPLISAIDFFLLAI